MVNYLLVTDLNTLPLDVSLYYWICNRFILNQIGLFFKRKRNKTLIPPTPNFVKPILFLIHTSRGY